MAKPRVFISSTFYDLHQSREDLERFIRSMGYDCIRHEAGAIPYAREVRLETSAYREVESCDILVTIIGGRFGSESKDNGGNSVTQSEILHALKKGIQVYIFVERDTLTEYEIWRINQDNHSMKYRFADDARIYTFIDHLYNLPNNNPIVAFSSVNEISNYLQEQWAGLFQRYLSQQLRAKEVAIIEDMRGIATTLKEMVNYLSESNNDKTTALESILLPNHPIFSRLAKLIEVKHRIYFSNREEMESLLEFNNWEKLDTDFADTDHVEEWVGPAQQWLVFHKDVFNTDGLLKIYAANIWDDEWITVRHPERKTRSPAMMAIEAARAVARKSEQKKSSYDDDIPF
jgi:hypothetical protein